LPKVVAPLVALFGLFILAGTHVMAAAAADADILDTHWKLVMVNGQPAEVGRREPHLIFKPDGGLAGSTGCNNLAAVYTLDGDKLAFGPIMTTRMYCQEVARTERELLKHLPDVASWTVDGDRLELVSASGVTIAILEKVSE
jgi:putative lipoprotein